MTELVVVSGKGGTGKTSILGSFAALAQGSVLADCDVDAPDLHLLLQPVVQDREPFFGGRVAKIRPEVCTACGRCLDHCRFRAISLEEQKNNGGYRVDPIACEGCGVCVRICPEHAIDFPEKQSGECMVSSTRFGPMVHARLGVAESNSGKLVTRVRRRAREIAETEDLELILVDGSPGIGCPVIASLAGASFVFVVTEPSVSGFHDLARVLELSGHFGLSSGVCVNKWDIHPELTRSIEVFCEERDISVLGRIPYDEGVTKAQIRGLPVVETDGCAASEGIRDVWERVRRQLGLP